MKIKGTAKVDAVTFISLDNQEESIVVEVYGDTTVRITEASIIIHTRSDRNYNLTRWDGENLILERNASQTP